MKVPIFISWSGFRSHQVARALHHWLPYVLQGVEPWISSEIHAGLRWTHEIAASLASTRFGIICITPENLSSTWVSFEAGALAKTLDDTLVCPYLFGLSRAEFAKVRGPISQFQAVQADRDETLHLVTALNHALGEHALGEERLRATFERWWPDLAAALERVSKDSAELPLSEFQLGLEGVYQDRTVGLKAFGHSIKHEVEAAQGGASARLWIVGSTLKGLLGFKYKEHDMDRLLQQLVATTCDIRLLLTRPDMADLRAEQESHRDAAKISTEVRNGVLRLKSAGVRLEQIRFYPGTPTVFAIATTDRMLLNPYPYERQAYKCFSLVVRSTRNEDDIFHQYLAAHFEGPWQHAQALADWPDAEPRGVPGDGARGMAPVQGDGARAADAVPAGS